VKRHPFLVQKTVQALRRWHVGTSGLVVAVSGGPDSVALLRALLASGTGGPGKLIVAHLNHQLRGAESDADAAFVRGLYSELATRCPDLELRVEHRDVRVRAQTEKANLENVARRLRYQWLLEVAQQAGLGWVATGHTADDQAETVLHHLLRGTGLKGLRGIAPCRDLGPGVKLLRPLLAVRRSDVLAFLEQLGQAWRQDSSNLDPTYTRNRLRLHLLPELARQYNPQIVASLCRLAEQAEEAYGAEEEAARALLAQTEYPRGGLVLAFNRMSLAAAPRSCLRAMWRLLWDREGWPTGAMTFASWDRLAAVAQGELTAIDLPGGIHARCRDRVIQISIQRMKDEG